MSAGSQLVVHTKHKANLDLMQQPSLQKLKVQIDCKKKQHRKYHCLTYNCFGNQILRINPGLRAAQISRRC